MSQEYKPSLESCNIKIPSYMRLVTNPMSHFIISVACYGLGILGGLGIEKEKWEIQLVERGYAEYNNKTKAFQLCNADQIVTNTGDESVINSMPTGLSTASSYIKYLLNELKDAKQEINVLESQLVDKENLIEKLRKSGEKPKKS